MADIPQNTTYNTGGASTAAPAAPKFNASDLLKYSAPKAPAAPTPTGPAAPTTPTTPATPNIFGAYSPVEQKITDYLGATKGTGFLPETPIGAPSEEKIFPDPKGYSPFVVPGTHTNPTSGVVPEKPMIQQFPSGGQMNIDVAHPGTLNKSVRATQDPLSVENASMLGTLSNKMFQVDHIIPLFLGGADTIANKQLLPNPIHEAKTKIQAVAQTLLDNGKINLDQARVMALTWQNRSANGIPDTNNYGEIPLETAEAIAKEWADFDAGKGPGPSFSQIMAGIPEAANTLGKGVLPEWARQFMIGLVSGATAGGVPLNSAPGATVMDKASGIAGEAIGMYSGVGLFSKMTGAAARATGLIKPGIKMAAGATEGGASILDALTPSAINAAEGLSTAEKATSAMSRFRAAIRPSTVMNDIRGKLATDIVGRAAKNAAAFGAYGQTGQLISDFTQPQENILGAHVDRLWQDLAFGALTGAAPGTWKGAGWVGGGTATLGLMAGENLQSALAQGVSMAALHKVGGFGQDLAKAQREAEQMTKDAVQKGGLTVLHTILGDKPGLSRVDPAAPPPSYDVSKLDDYLKEGVAKLADMRDKGQITPTLWMRLETSLRASVGALKTLDMPDGDRTSWNGLSSMAKFSKDRNNVSDLTIPNALQPYADKFASTFPERVVEKPAQEMNMGRWEIADIPRGEGNTANAGATGEIRFTGQMASPENFKDHQIFQEKLRSGEASPYGIIMNSNDPLFGILSRDSNRAITPKMVSDGHATPIDPENHLRVFAIVTDKATGEKSIIRTGLSVPTRERIGTITVGEDGKKTVVGHPNAFNSHPDIIGDNPKFSPNNPDYNNKTIATIINNRNLSAIPVRFTAFLDKKIRDENPYTIGKIGDEELGMAKQMQEGIGHPAELNTPEENIMLAKRLQGSRDITPIVSKAAEQLSDQGHNAASIVAAEPLTSTNEPRQQALFEMLDKADDALVKSSTPEELKVNMKDLLGVDLKIEDAQALHENKASVTGPDIVKVMDAAIDEGRATPMTAGNFDTYIKPLEKSKEFQSSTAGVVFSKMPVLSKPQMHDVRANKISSLSGKSLLESEPIIKTAPEAPTGSPEYQKALEEVQMVGLGTGRQYSPEDLDTYATQLIKKIKESGLSPEEQAQLGQEAMKLIQRDELNSRGVMMGPPEQVGSTLEDVTPETSADRFTQYVTEIKDKIASETGATEAPAMRSTPEEMSAINKATIPAAVKADVKPYFEAISQGKSSDPTTYVRGHDQAFDSLAQQAWGKDYQKNYGLMQLLSDRSALGRRYYEAERVTKKGIKPALMSTETRGEQIGQPKDVLAAVPEGPQAVSAAYARRKAAYTGGVSEDLTKLPAEAAEVVGGGKNAEGENVQQSGRITDPNQAPEENVQDLTQYESELQKGLLDEEARGADPVLSPKRGVEDAVSQIFSLVERYNTAVREGSIKGSTVHLGNLDKIKKDILTQIEKEGSVQIKATEAATKAQDTIAELDAQDAALANVGGSKAMAYAKKVKAANDETRRQLSEIVKKYAKPQGAGGPGDTLGQFGSLTGMMGMGMSQTTPATTTPQGLPGKSPSQSITDYLQGISRVDNTPAAPQQMPPMPQPKAQAPTPPAPIQPASPIVMGPTKTTSTYKPQTPIPAPKPDDSPTTGLTSGKGPLNPPAKGLSYYLGKFGGGFPQTSNPNIAGIDTSAYAEDPNHATAVKNIMAELPNMQTAQDYQAYIAKRAPKSPVTGAMIAAAAAHNQLTPDEVKTMIATMVQDSAIGTVGAAKKSRNPGNVGNTGSSLRIFKTWQDGVNAVSNFIAQHRNDATSTPAHVTDKSRYIDKPL